MILNQLATRERPWDVCIVGSGPVGMALAFECESLGLEVLVLESGGSYTEPQPAEASRARIVDARRHADMGVAVCRALGGTSWTWAGRCVPYDDVDFEPRPHVPGPGWPFRHDEIRPWYGKAAGYLLCGGDVFRSAPKSMRSLGEDVSAAFLERWASEPRLALIHRGRLERSTGITLCLNSTAAGLDFGENGRTVIGVRAVTPAGPLTARAGDVVIAAGGVESTRLLLAVQRQGPNHFGGADGALGRYYMGHISGKIADIIFDPPTAAADLDFKLDDGVYTRRRLMLTPSAQQSHRLLNASFWPDNPPFHDARHGSGVLSAVFLALAFPPIGRRLVAEAIRLAHTGPKPYRVAAHLRNLLLGAVGGARDVQNILRDRFLTKPRKPGFLVPSQSGRYALHYHAEQEPNRQSRIVLIGEADRFGVPRVSIDLRYSEADARSVVGSHEVIDQALRASGRGRLEYWHPPEERAGRVMEQASDGFHQIGSTRMGTDSSEGVVDSNLKVHGVHNLHVASSSVFPTSGQANSTFLAVALAVRLAHRLKARASRVTTVEGAAHLESLKAI
jgi:choline dehydrogenase-like flavoprotein